MSDHPGLVSLARNIKFLTSHQKLDVMSETLTPLMFPLSNFPSTNLTMFLGYKFPLLLLCSELSPISIPNCKIPWQWSLHLLK